MANEKEKTAAASTETKVETTADKSVEKKNRKHRGRIPTRHRRRKERASRFYRKRPELA